MPDINAYSIQQDLLDFGAASEPCRVLALGITALKSKCSCDAGNIYLPPFAGELKEGTPFAKYKTRLNKSELKNYFTKAVQFSIGQVFKKDVKINNYQNLSKEIQDFLGIETIGFNNDVDKRGTSANQFIKNIFEDALINPAAFVLVDSPNYSKTDSEIVVNGVKYPNNLETEKRFRLNPYFVRIPFVNVISCITKFDSSLGLIVDKFGYLDNKRINEKGGYDYDIIEWTQSQITKTPYINDKAGESIVSENLNRFIPLSILILGKKVTDYMGVPPLMDLAMLNIVHFQKQSEHNNMLGWVKQPTWHLSGIDKEWLKNNPMGCGSAVVTDNEGKMENVGIDATAESGSMDDLKHDEDYMESYTLSLLESGAVKTATATNAIVGSTTSNIASWAKTLKDFCDDLYYKLLTVKQFNFDVQPDVFVNTEFTKPFDTETANFIQTAASGGRLSTKTFLEVIKSWGMLDEDFNIDDELNNLSSEHPDTVYLPDEGKSDPQGVGNA